MFDLTGSTVLVTGGSRGIGRAVGLELGRAGANIAIGYRHSDSAAREVVSELEGLSVRARAFSGDVSNPTEVRRLVDSAAEWSGRLDGLVTSAGITRGDPIDRASVPDIDSVVRTNLLGTIWTVQSALPYLRCSPHPAVVTVSSLVAAHPATAGAPYQASKAGVEQLTRALALELAPMVRVNSVAPGFILTDMTRDLSSSPSGRSIIAELAPLRRWGEPEDVAKVVRFLLSTEARWVTGNIVGVDGGIVLQ